MKKIYVLMIAVIICVCFTSFAFAAEDADAVGADTLPAAFEESDLADPFGITFDEPDPADMADLVETAIRKLAEEYTESYWDRNLAKAVTLDIRNTRVICIKDEPDESQEEYILSVQEEYFGDVRYIIEFLLYEDYMAGGIYSFPASEDVIIHDDGSMEWVSGYLDKYRGRTFSVDYSGFIEQVIDLHDQCNQVIRFEGEEIVFESTEQQ